MAEESRSPTPFNGYVTAESESGSGGSNKTVIEPPSDGRKRKKRRFRAVSLPQRDARGRFLPRSGSGRVGGSANGGGSVGGSENGGEASAAARAAAEASAAARATAEASAAMRAAQQTWMMKS